jgi:hypothetical protein
MPSADRRGEHYCAGGPESSGDEVPGVAHDCNHGTAPHSIKCIINEDESARAACVALFERSRSFRPRSNYRD